ncbi:MAG: flagellar hook-associated protein FlgL [Sporolactobacillus sp.]
MRVTQAMMSNTILNNINSNYAKLADYQNELSSGKKLTKPSDDPVGASLSVSYRADLDHITQYQKNVTTAQKWMSSTSDALTQVSSILDQINDLTLQANNGTQTSSELNADATEVDQLTQQLVTIGNTQVGSQYIFSGADSANPPLSMTTDANGNTVVTLSSASMNPSNANVNMTVNDGTQIAVNVAPGKVFSQQLFTDLSNLTTSLRSGNTSGLSNSLAALSTDKDTVVNVQADIGAKQQRLDMISGFLSDQSTTTTQIKSNNEDADYAQTIVGLNQQQSVFQASLAAGARIIQKSLVDYLN